MIDAKITLEVQKNGVQKTVHVKEGETAGARRLLITLTNNGQIIDVTDKTVAAYIQLSTGTELVTDATSVEETTNIIVFEIPTLNEGEYLLEILVQDGDELIYSPTFRIAAEAALYEAYVGDDYESNTAYIIVTDDDFYTEDEIDTMLEGKQNTLTAGSGITITNDVISATGGGGGGASSADDVSYDNTDSGLTATNVQDAIDEVAASGGGAMQIGTYSNSTFTVSYTGMQLLGYYGDGYSLYFADGLGGMNKVLTCRFVDDSDNTSYGAVELIVCGIDTGAEMESNTTGYSNEMNLYRVVVNAQGTASVISATEITVFAKTLISTDNEIPTSKAVKDFIDTKIPGVTSSDNGKYLKVINGNWAVGSPAVDSSPTNHSGNLVTSGGVYSAIQTVSNNLTALNIGTIVTSGGVTTVTLGSGYTGSAIWSAKEAAKKLYFSGDETYVVLTATAYIDSSNNVSVELIVYGIGFYRIIVDFATNTVLDFAKLSGIGLPAVTSSDDGKVLTYDSTDGWVVSTPSGNLPSGTTSGDMLVWDGTEWDATAVTIPSAGSIASGATGYATGGDVYTALGDKISAPSSPSSGNVLTYDTTNGWVASAPATELPSVSSTDNGDVLTVVSGVWAKAAPSGGASVVVSDTAPASPTEGTLWVDTSDNTLDVPNGDNLSY